jgi:DNA polymerase-3 subunit delta
MAFKTDADAGALARGWDKGDFHRVYLFAGPDTLARDETFERLKTAFLGADGVMNLDLFDGNEADAGKILSAAATLPFFGGRRMVAVRRADGLGTADMNRLADGVDGLPASNCLVLLWDERPDQRTVLVQAVKGAGAVAVFWPPFENQLPQWVADRAGRFKKRMDRAAADALLDAVGPSLPDLYQEIGKLALYVKDRPAISVEDVGALRGERVSFQFMEWERALWRRDRKKSLGVLTAQKERGDSVEGMLPQVVRAVQKIWMAKALFLEKKGDDRAIFETLRVKSLDVQRDLRAAVSRWSWDELLGATDALVEADHVLKTGRSDPDADLTRLVLSLTKSELSD